MAYHILHKEEHLLEFSTGGAFLSENDFKSPSHSRGLSKDFCCFGGSARSWLLHNLSLQAVLYHLQTYRSGSALYCVCYSFVSATDIVMHN